MPLTIVCYQAECDWCARLYPHPNPSMPRLLEEIEGQHWYILPYSDDDRPDEIVCYCPACANERGYTTVPKEH